LKFYREYPYYKFRGKWYKNILCEHCKIEPATQKHHISYFPEKIMNLCFSCHLVIHKSKHPMYDKFKQYDKGDSHMFYAKKHKQKIDYYWFRYYGIEWKANPDKWIKN